MQNLIKLSVHELGLSCVQRKKTPSKTMQPVATARTVKYLFHCYHMKQTKQNKSSLQLHRVRINSGPIERSQNALN